MTPPYKIINRKHPLTPFTEFTNILPVCTVGSLSIKRFKERYPRLPHFAPPLSPGIRSHLLPLSFYVSFTRFSRGRRTGGGGVSEFIRLPGRYCCKYFNVARKNTDNKGIYFPPPVKYDVTGGFREFLIGAGREISDFCLSFPLLNKRLFKLLGYLIRIFRYEKRDFFVLVQFFFYQNNRLSH